MINCKICNKEVAKLGNLAKHLGNSHKDTSREEYYRKFLQADPNAGICIVCGSDTKLINLDDGFLTTCSHKCGGILFRKEQKADQKRFKKFRDKVSENQKVIWSERKETGEDKTIRAAISATVKEQNEKLTEDQLREKYGWLNRLSGQERQDKIDDMLDKSLRKWAEEATEEEKETMYARRLQTRIDLNLCTPKEFKNEFEEYASKVRSLTAKNYNKFKETINPNNLPRGRGKSGYHVDHIVSIWDCFMHGVLVTEAASPKNLQMLHGLENNKKWKNSWGDVRLLKGTN